VAFRCANALVAVAPAEGGCYPTEYCVRHDAATGEHSVSMEKFTRRAARSTSRACAASGRPPARAARRGRAHATQSADCVRQRTYKSAAGADTSSAACRPFTGTDHEERIMGINKDQVEGRVNEVEGKIKEVTGRIVGNEKLEQKGRVQKIVGEAQAKVGDLKKDVKDAIKSA
jgi:uncharacterized protein YjbJ (UPF0337 family)